jgi:hypothetical protein
MQKKEKAPKREDLYNITIVRRDPNLPGGILKRTWHRVAVDDPVTWERTAKKIKQLFPEVIHVNVYGGITELFKQRIKF